MMLGDSTMFLPQWWMHAVLVFWLVFVGMAYSTGTSPVLGLIGIILATTSILVRGLATKPS
jgi:cell shape-determining protein MreD